MTFKYKAKFVQFVTKNVGKKCALCIKLVSVLMKSDNTSRKCVCCNILCSVLCYAGKL